jgi:starvation-inducible outer membrane lipoprotein
MKNIFKNKSLKTIFILILILVNTNCLSQKNKCKNQTEIIKIILNDIQFKNLIINKNTIKIENSVCGGKIERISVQNGKEKINLSFLKEKIKSEDKISFIEYEETNKIIYAELSIFHKNAIYSILLKKQNISDLRLINSWMKLIKREK